MRTIFLICCCLLISNLLPAQNVKLNVTPKQFSVRTDSMILSMDISVNIENMESKNAVMLIPVLTGEDRKVLLPYIQLNGKQKQKLLLRNQLLRKKNDQPQKNTAYLTEGIGDSYFRSIRYNMVIPAERWMDDATLSFRRYIITPSGEQMMKDTLLITQQETSILGNIITREEVVPAPIIEVYSPSTDVASTPTILKYKGSYITPETDDVDMRNRKELNFNLDEAKMMADINPQMLSLRELYTVALSYTDDRARFYKIIAISAKLYPVHPIANLNAAAAAIEQGDAKSASKFLPMALHESLAYKNCRGVYELMIGNTYEGIRVLKSAKTEGSEEAAFNLNVFFEKNKRP